MNNNYYNDSYLYDDEYNNKPKYIPKYTKSNIFVFIHT